MDNATWKAHIKTVATKMSLDMEDIIENGEVRFKETIMKGEPLGESEDFQKVLRLRWDTEKDEISMDVNYKEKKKDAEDSAYFNCPDSTVYLWWEREDGHIQCRLVTGKTQLASRVKIIIQRMDLVASINSVRLAGRMKESLKIAIGRGALLHRLIGCLSHAENSILAIQRVHGGTN
jgi:hypothetical protein